MRNKILYRFNHNKMAGLKLIFFILAIVEGTVKTVNSIGKTGRVLDAIRGDLRDFQGDLRSIETLSIPITKQDTQLFSISQPAPVIPAPVIPSRLRNLAEEPSSAQVNNRKIPNLKPESVPISIHIGDIPVAEAPTPYHEDNRNPFELTILDKKHLGKTWGGWARDLTPCDWAFLGLLSLVPGAFIFGIIFNRKW